MNREKRRRQLQLKIQLEKLETRWLMRSGLTPTPALGAPAHLTAERDARRDALARHIPTAIAHWLDNHSSASIPAGLTHEKLAFQKLVPAGFGAWGALRLLDRLETQGHHQFDALYQQIAARFNVWSQHHPALAAMSGITLAPLQTSSAGTSTPASSPITTSGGAAGAPVQPGTGPNSGSAPDSGIPPPIPPVDTLALYGYCCPHDADEASPPIGDFPPSAPNPEGSPVQPQLALASDASLITGEFLEDHQLATYLSQGQQNGIDLQYTSLQAGSDAVFVAAWSANSNLGSGTITTASLALVVNGTSQGTAVTITSVPGTGPYLIELGAPSASSLATGIYPDTLNITKNHPTGPPTGDIFNESLMVDNGSSSPYGAGWSIGGLQQITVVTLTKLVMITDGSSAPEQFASTNGSTYMGYVTDTSALTYSSTTTNYTRAYADGSKIIFNYSGQETSVTDSNGNTTSFTYITSGAAAGALHTITDPVGLQTTLSYDSSGHLSAITDPANRTTTFTIGSSTDNLTKIVDPDNAATQYGYNSSHEMTSETNPDNQTASITYDSLNLFGSETLFDGTSRTSVSPADEADLIAYGSSGLLSFTMTYLGEVTDPDNSTTALTFDATGGVVQQSDGRGAITYITNNSNDWPATVLDPVNGATTYSYDMAGNVNEIIRPDGSTETILYNDNFDLPTHVVDFNGNVTTYTLDSHGNITQRTDPDGQSENYTYNSAGQVLTDTDALGKTTSYVYDSLGRLTDILEPGATVGTIQYGYDTAGDVLTITDEVGDTTSYTYDKMGRVLSTQDPVQAAAGKDTAYSYDAAGNLISITDALGRITTYGYNARNELVSVEDPLLATTTYGYDPEGNNTTVTDARGKTTTYSYDLDNDLVSTTDPMGNVTSYGYDLDDREITATDGRGNTTSYTYDNLDDVSTVTLPGQTVPTSYTYLCSGQPQLAENVQIPGRRVAPSVGHIRLKAA